MNQTSEPPRARRPSPVAIPVGVVLLLILSALALAVSHLAAKGPGEAKDITPAQAATSQTPPDRGPYNAQDYAEPKPN